MIETEGRSSADHDAENDARIEAKQAGGGSPGDVQTDDSRKSSERDFFNEAVQTDSRGSVRKVYDIAERSHIFYRDALLERCTGRAVLEYGCGQGSHAFSLADAGAKRIVGIDISDESICKATDRIGESRAPEALSFEVMDAEAMDFEEDTFGLVCGSSILHHLDLKRSMAELARVMHPDGEAVFYEPLGHNPAINCFRKLTPQFRTEDERPLVRNDLRQIESSFERAEFHYFHMLSLLSIPLLKTPLFRPVRNALDSLDHLLLGSPTLGRLAWVVVMVLSGPKAD